MTRPFMLFASLLVISLGTRASAAPLCKPVLTVRDVGFSSMINLKRIWTATVHVDASRCAGSTGGLFALAFIRLAENAPDLEFSEPFIWHGSQAKVRVEFWADEAVHDYWIAEVAPCACRGD